MIFYKILIAEDRRDGTMRIRGYAYDDVPGGANAEGVAWTTVASQFQQWQWRREGSRPGPATPVPTAVETALMAGEAFEVEYNFVVPQGADLLARAEAAIEEIVVANRQRLGQMLDRWGRTGTIDS